VILAQVFKTADGADKRARFETAHCADRFTYRAVRYINGWGGDHPDGETFDRGRFLRGQYTWRLARAHHL
jgi:hypothetical protein